MWTLQRVIQPHFYAPVKALQKNKNKAKNLLAADTCQIIKI
jgi:hypothetical protein